MNKIKTIKWVDAVSYYNLEEMPNKLPEKETVGEIIEENEHFIIIKNPKTKNYNSYSYRSVTEKEKAPTFAYIPRGMIKKIL